LEEIHRAYLVERRIWSTGALRPRSWSAARMTSSRR